MSKRLLRDVEVAAAIGIPVKTLRNWRHTGGGPSYYKTGRAVRYDLDEVGAWLETTKVSSTSAYRERGAA